MATMLIDTKLLSDTRVVKLYKQHLRLVDGAMRSRRSCACGPFATSASFPGLCRRRHRHPQRDTVGFGLGARPQGRSGSRVENGVMASGAFRVHEKGREKDESSNARARTRGRARVPAGVHPRGSSLSYEGVDLSSMSAEEREEQLENERIAEDLNKPGPRKKAAKGAKRSKREAVTETFARAVSQSNNGLTLKWTKARIRDGGADHRVRMAWTRSCSRIDNMFTSFAEVDVAGVHARHVDWHFDQFVITGRRRHLNRRSAASDGLRYGAETKAGVRDGPSSAVGVHEEMTDDEDGLIEPEDFAWAQTARAAQRVDGSRVLASGLKSGAIAGCAQAQALSSEMVQRQHMLSSVGAGALSTSR